MKPDAIEIKIPEGLFIRPELSNDYQSITELNVKAFGQPGEAKLVEDLRRNPQFIKGLSLVAVLDGKLLGHILFFPIIIRNTDKVYRSLALAPMAVLPDYQGRGIGSALVIAGIDEARAGKFGSVIVMGHRDYYPRFGFKKASQYGIFPPFVVPDDVFFALELQPGALERVKGIVEYPLEFAEV